MGDQREQTCLLDSGNPVSESFVTEALRTGIERYMFDDALSVFDERDNLGGRLSEA